MAAKLRRSLAILASVVVTLLLAIITAIPAFAAEAANATPENGQQIAYEEPEFLNEERGDNFIILPDAPKKEGYTFSGWRVNGSTNLYSSGKEVSVKAGEKVTLTPVYCSIFRSRCAFWGGICFAIFFTLFILRAFGDNSREKEIVLNILITISVIASSFLITASSLPSLTP